MDATDRKIMKKLVWEDHVAALRDGRKHRAATFKPKKGKGSYDRKKQQYN